MPSLVSHKDLENIVRISTMLPQLKVDSWNSELLSWQGRRRIFRFFGDADNFNVRTAWSNILKEIRKPEQRDAADLSEKHWAYWERESLIYEAGTPKLFDGNIDAPTCYSVASPANDVRWIWLEDLGHVDDQSWTSATYWNLPKIGGEWAPNRGKFAIRPKNNHLLENSPFPPLV